MATSFTTHTTGQVITAADINLIQTAVNTLESAPAGGAGADPLSTGLGFKNWNFDPAHAADGTAQSPSLYNVMALWLPAGTVTNLHMWSTVGAAPTNNYMALYSSAGALLSQSTNQASNLGSTGLKTYPLAAPQVVTAGMYYVLQWTNGGTNPSSLRNGGSRAWTALTNNAVKRTPFVSTGLTTTAPSNFPAFSGDNNYVFWVAAS